MSGSAIVEQATALHELWIGGGRHSHPDGAVFPVIDPATEEMIAWVADGSPAQGVEAVDAAQAAAAGWAATSPRHRSELLRAAYDIMIADSERLAGIIAAENGKTMADARGEVSYAADFFRWYAEEAVRTDGSYGESPAGGSRTITNARPVGIALLVTPWNFPAAMVTRKIAPALAAGCTTILKPAAETPLTALAIAEILHSAGVPAGVVNVVPTTDANGVVAAILSDPRVRKLSFTGSTGVGRALMEKAARRVVNVSMELGGNAPFVVTADADIEAAVAGAMIAKMRNGGQACTAANRFYVHEDVIEEFTKSFGDAVERLAVGPATDESSQIGPLISRRAVAGVTALVDAAIASGARITHRASLPGTTGYYYPPTVLRDVAPDADILKSEIFGPVAPIVSWRDTNELLAAVNATEYGLAAYVYSGDGLRAVQLAEAIDAGMVGVNRGAVSDASAPFGGVKQSGVGREGAREGIRAFQETQYLSVDWPAL